MGEMLTIFCDSVSRVGTSRIGSRSAWRDCRVRATASSGRCSPIMGMTETHRGAANVHRYYHHQWTIRNTMFRFGYIVQRRGAWVQIHHPVARTR